MEFKLCEPAGEAEGGQGLRVKGVGQHRQQSVNIKRRLLFSLLFNSTL